MLIFVKFSSYQHIILIFQLEFSFTKLNNKFETAIPRYMHAMDLFKTPIHNPKYAYDSQSVPETNTQYKITNIYYIKESVLFADILHITCGVIKKFLRLINCLQYKIILSIVN